MNNSYTKLFIQINFYMKASLKFLITSRKGRGILQTFTDIGESFANLWREVFSLVLPCLSRAEVSGLLNRTRTGSGWQITYCVSVWMFFFCCFITLCKNLAWLSQLAHCLGGSYFKKSFYQRCSGANCVSCKCVVLWLLHCPLLKERWQSIFTDGVGVWMVTLALCVCPTS